MKNPLEFLFDWLDTLRERVEHAHATVSDDAPADVEIADATPNTERPAFEEIGAWCGWESLMNPERDVDFAKDIGLTTLEVIVNKMPPKMGKGWAPRPYEQRDTKLIQRLVETIARYGLIATFMVWIMPHEAYIKEMGRRLVALCNSTGVKRVDFDIEEPWTLARDKKGRKLSPAEYNRMAELVRVHIVEPLAEIGVECWGTGIRYTPTSKLRRLLNYFKDKRAAALGPVLAGGVIQLYSTATSKASPLWVIAKGVATWRKKFGKDLPIILGGAAYRQDGIKGHTLRSALTAWFDKAEEWFKENPTQRRIVMLWGLNSIRRSPRIAAVIQDITRDAYLPGDNDE